MSDMQARRAPPAHPPDQSGTTGPGAGPIQGQDAVLMSVMSMSALQYSTEDQQC